MGNGKPKNDHKPGDRHMRFKNKTVVITGSGAGIGKAAAIQFAQEGANVVINSRGNSGEKMKKTDLK